MCSRYYVFREGKQWEVHPGDKARAARYDFEQGCLVEAAMEWGFPSPDEKGLVINARVESIFERPMFRPSMESRRCVLLADGFYEWNARKEKAEFSHKEGGHLYLAGIYEPYKGTEHFVILTTEANESVRPIHDRMPLILSKEEAVKWILSREAAEGYLKKRPEELERNIDYEQQCLEF